MKRFWKGFFWGEPSHKSRAWVGVVSGLGVVALALWLFTRGRGAPLFLFALLFLGLANVGWGAELFPRRRTTISGWARVGRWGCALVGAILAILSLLWGLAFGPVFGLVIAGTGLLQVFEFAPGGPANRP
ncbi:MAG: hypothetical protein IVW57_11655 [Ktedonobacterales bacterium]|nr:hypothetical protein [Ktedonobacterales bacterium]